MVMEIDPPLHLKPANLADFGHSREAQPETNGGHFGYPDIEKPGLLPSANRQENGDEPQHREDLSG